MAESQPDTSLMGDNGDNNQTTEVVQPTWMEQLPDDLKANESLTGFETIGDLAKAHLDADGKQEGLRLPGEDASDDERNAFYTELGRPENADGYDMSAPENLPEGLAYDTEKESKYRDLFHDMGLTRDQAKKIWDTYHAEESSLWQEAMDSVKQSQSEAVNALKKEAGTDEKYNEMIEISKRAAKEFCDSDFYDEIIKVGSLGDDPSFIKAFYNIGKAVMDDQGVISVKGNSSKTVTTPGGTPVFNSFLKDHNK